MTIPTCMLSSQELLNYTVDLRIIATDVGWPVHCAADAAAMLARRRSKAQAASGGNSGHPGPPTRSIRRVCRLPVESAAVNVATSCVLHGMRPSSWSDSASHSATSAKFAVPECAAGGGQSVRSGLRVREKDIFFRAQ